GGDGPDWPPRREAPGRRSPRGWPPVTAGPRRTRRRVPDDGGPAPDHWRELSEPAPRRPPSLHARVLSARPARRRRWRPGRRYVVLECLPHQHLFPAWAPLRTLSASQPG